MAATDLFQAERAALLATKPIPIASLDPPTQEGFIETSVKAVVTLIWPYSSSTQSAAILVAEPDFRLRRIKGQIRVQLKGVVARAVGESGIAIGDIIYLGLEDSRWVADAVGVQTSGRSVDGELLFERNLALQIERAGKALSFLYVNEPQPPPTPASPDIPAAAIVQQAIEPVQDQTWSSPVFLRSRNHAKNWFSPAYDIFSDEDEFDEGRSRKRVKFARLSGEWRYAPESLSPPKERPALVPVGAPSDASEDGAWEHLPDSEPHTPMAAAPRNVNVPNIPVLDLTISPEPPRDGGNVLHSLILDITKAESPLLPQLQTNFPCSTFAAPLLTPKVLSTPASPRLQPAQSAGLPQVSSFALNEEAGLNHSHELGADQAGESSRVPISTGSGGGNLLSDHDHDQDTDSSSSSPFSANDVKFRETLPPEGYADFGSDGATVSRAYSTVGSVEGVHIKAAATLVDGERTLLFELDIPEVKDSIQDLGHDQSSFKALSNDALPRFQTTTDKTLIEKSSTHVYETDVDDDKQVLDTQFTAEMDQEATDLAVADRERHFVRVLETRTQNTAANDIIIVDLSSDVEEDVGRAYDEGTPSSYEPLQDLSTENDEEITSYEVLQDEVLRGLPHEEQPRGYGKAFDDSDYNQHSGIISPDADGLHRVETSTDEERRSVLYDVAQVNQSRRRSQSDAENYDSYDTVDKVVGRSYNGSDYDVADNGVNAHSARSREKQETRSAEDARSGERQEIINSDGAESSEEHEISISVKELNHIESRDLVQIDIMQEDLLEVEFEPPSLMVDFLIQPTSRPSPPASTVSWNHTLQSPRASCQVNQSARYSNLDASERPPTPDASQDPLTQSQDFIITNKQPDQILEDSLPLTPLPTQTELKAPGQARERPISQLRSSLDSVIPRQSTQRRQQRRRISTVPDIISPWFMSRRVGPVDDSEENSDNVEVTETASELSSLPEFSPEKLEQLERRIGPRTSLAAVASRQKHNHEVDDSPPPVAGLRTSLSYYTPLSNLDTYLNASPPKQNTAIDVFAVITSPTSKPSRAKAGPREQFTITHISDMSCFPKTTEVHVFRRWKKSLPVANVGDVILLRSFLVRSRKRQCYLLSGEASAWYVWKLSNYQENHADNIDNKPIWAKLASNNTGALIEECKGAPVELGSEEREHAIVLRTWWEAINHAKSNVKVSPMPGDNLLATV